MPKCRQNFTSGTMGTPETCALAQGSVYQLPGHNANPGVMYTIGQGHTLIYPSLPASTVVSPENHTGNFNQGNNTSVYAEHNNPSVYAQGKMTMGHGNPEGQNQLANLNQVINSGVFTHSNTIGSGHITGQSGSVILASPGNGCIPISNTNNVGHSNPEGQLIFNQGNTNAPGNTLVYSRTGNLGNCNIGSHNMYG